MRVGILYSRIRVEEKLIVTALEERGVAFDLIDVRRAVFDLQRPDGWRQYGVVLERCVSHSRALAALQMLDGWGAPCVNVGLCLSPDFDVARLRAVACRHAGDAAVRIHGYEPAFRASRRTPLVRAFNVALREAGVRPRYKLKTGTSDMNVVGPRWGCPILAYGPGDSALDHKPGEHVVIEDYVRAIAVLEDVLQAL